MSVKKLTALFGATIAVAAGPAAALASTGTNVTVRVEGVNKTLLAKTSVSTHRGWITKDRTPKGKCPAANAAGALDVATNHNWGGHYDKGVGLEVTSVLGETHAFNSPYFWEFFVNNRPASLGVCEQKLRRGEQLLFAAVTQKGFEYPIGIRAPRKVTVNHRFAVHVVWWGASGRAKPLNHALVTVHGKSVRTRANGIVEIKWGSPGTIVVNASRHGYIRPVPVSVHVSS